MFTGARWTRIHHCPSRWYFCRKLSYRDLSAMRVECANTVLMRTSHLQLPRDGNTVDFLGKSEVRCRGGPRGPLRKAVRTLAVYLPASTSMVT